MILHGIIMLEQKERETITAIPETCVFSQNPGAANKADAYANRALHAC